MDVKNILLMSFFVREDQYCRMAGDIFPPDDGLAARDIRVLGMRVDVCLLWIWYP